MCIARKYIVTHHCVLKATNNVVIGLFAVTIFGEYWELKLVV